MKSLTILFFLTVIVLACTVKTDVTTSQAIDEAVTKSVLDHHWLTFQQNDLDGVMEDYTEESVLITPDNTFRGLEEIRKNFEFAFTLFPSDSTAMTLQQTVIEQDVAYIIWSADAPKLKLSFGTDTFLVRDGKIIRQTYAGVAE